VHPTGGCSAWSARLARQLSNVQETGDIVISATLCVCFFYFCLEMILQSIVDRVRAQLCDCATAMAGCPSARSSAAATP
jgi:hypothetical protein